MTRMYKFQCMSVSLNLLNLFYTHTIKTNTYAENVTKLKHESRNNFSTCAQSYGYVSMLHFILNIILLHLILFEN